ncbi:MAG: M56 family metallopeptidase [Ruminococcus sp.]|nr:M56 family metallopeptidase [Ruminococcus sp.]
MDILSVIITSALLGLAGLVFRSVMGKRVSGRVMRVLWAVIFIKFALPVNIPSVTSVMNLAENRNAAVSEEENTTAPPPVSDGELLAGAPAAPDGTVYSSAYREDGTSPAAVSDSTDNIRTADAAEKRPDNINAEKNASAIGENEETPPQGTDISEIIRSVYLAVAVMLTAAAAGAYILCAVRFSRFPETENGNISGIIRDFAKAKRLNAKRIKAVSGDITTPAVFGIIFPKIILPREDEYDDRSLSHIIAHELTHIYHADPLWNAATLIICALNWYDPVVWLCRYCYLKDAERHCDESVTAALDSGSRKEYAQSLLKCAARHSSGSHRLSLLSGFGESDIKSRIKAVLSAKRLRMGTAAAGIAVIAVCALVFGTGAREDIGLTVSGNGDIKYISDKDGAAGTVALKAENIEDMNGRRLDECYNISLETDSERYRFGRVKAEVVLCSVKAYRFNGEERQETSGNASRVIDLDPGSPSFSLYASFDFQNTGAVPHMEVNVTYTLKNGIFGESEEYAVSRYITAQNSEDHIRSALLEHFDMGSFTASEVSDGYEIRSPETELYIFVPKGQDKGDGYIRRDKDGGYEELTEIMYSPFSASISLKDVTGDNIPEMILDTRITGTGVTEHPMQVFDAAAFREIPINEEAIDGMIKGVTVKETVPNGDLFDINIGGRTSRAVSEFFPEGCTLRKNSDGSVYFSWGHMYGSTYSGLYCCSPISVYCEEYSHSVSSIEAIYIRLEYDGEKLSPAGRMYFSSDGDNPFITKYEDNTVKYFDNFTAVVSDSGGAKFYPSGALLDLVLVKNSFDSPVLFVYSRDYKRSVRIEQQGDMGHIRTRILDLTHDGSYDLAIIDEGGEEPLVYVIDGKSCEEIPVNIEAARAAAEQYSIEYKDGSLPLSEAVPAEKAECIFGAKEGAGLYMITDIISQAEGGSYKLARMRASFSYDPESNSLNPISFFMFRLDESAEPEDIPVVEEGLPSEVLYSRSVSGLGDPLILDLVKSGSEYSLRLSTIGGAAVSRAVLPVTELEMEGLDVSECFKFTEMNGLYPINIIFSIPEGNGMNRAYFYLIGDMSSLTPLAYSDINGNVKDFNEGVAVSGGLWTDGGVFYDTVTEGGQTAEVRYTVENSSYLREIMHARSGGAFTSLESINVSDRTTPGNDARTVRYENGEAVQWYPSITDDIYPVGELLQRLRTELRTAVYTEPAAYPEKSELIYETVFYIGGEFAFLRLYSGDRVEAEDNGGRKGLYTMTSKGAQLYNDALAVSAGGLGEYIVSKFANQIEQGDRRMLTVMDSLVYSEENKYPPSKWQVMRNISVFENVSWERAREYGSSATEVYKLSFDLNSSDPRPFKNGRNELAVEIGNVYLSNLARITRICDYDKYEYHARALNEVRDTADRTPEYTVYDFLYYCRGETEFGSPDDIDKEMLLFYLLYSGEPSGLSVEERQFGGLTYERLMQAAEHAFGSSAELPRQSVYYDEASDKYYLLGMGIAPPDNYLISNTVYDGDLAYVTVEEYNDSMCLDPKQTTVFTLRKRDGGGYYILSSVRQE